MRLALFIVPLLAMAACSNVEKSQSTMPPLPTAKVYGAAELPSVVGPPQSSVGGIILRWSNPPSPFASNYATGIEASADFKSWQELARQPYQNQGYFEVINRQPTEFFRVFNTLRTTP